MPMARVSSSSSSSKRGSISGPTVAARTPTDGLNVNERDVQWYGEIANGR